MTREQQNAQLFEILKRGIERARRDGTPFHDLARMVEKAALFARFHFPGVLADLELENTLRELGSQLEPVRGEIGLRDHVERVLHVATSLHATGGHSSVVTSWIRSDTERESYLAVTNQRNPSQFPERLQKWDGLESRTLFVSSAGETVPQKAAALRRFVLDRGVDVVVLHIDPHDVIPIIALAGANVPVAFFDHGDHVFSLGRLYADVIISFRDIALWPAGEVGSRSMTIPLPVDPSGASGARMIGRHDDGPVLVTMATEYKFEPVGGLDFFRTWGAILDAVPAAKLHMIGVSPEAAKRLSGGALHPRLHPVGRLSDPSEYLNWADYFVEPFPVGTILGSLEAILAGAAPVFNYRTINVYGEASRSVLPAPYREQVPAYSTEAAYASWVVQELASGRFRTDVAPRLRQWVQNVSVDRWSEHFNTLYDRLAHLGGRPFPAAVLEERVKHAASFTGRGQWAEFRGSPINRVLDAVGGAPLRERATVAGHVIRATKGGEPPSFRAMYQLVRLMIVGGRRVW